MWTEEHLNIFNTYLLNDSMMLRSLVRASSSTGSDVNRLFLQRNPITLLKLVQFVLISSSRGSIFQTDHSILPQVYVYKLL